jgi:hypothetical protein
VIIHRLAGQDGHAGPAEPGEGRLLPTPDTGCSPNGHGRRGGRAGHGHQSGQGLDVAATALTPAQAAGSSPAAWAEYEPAIRRWETVIGCPAPPPAEPGPSGRPRLSAPFAEWMMGLSLRVICPNFHLCCSGMLVGALSSASHVGDVRDDAPSVRRKRSRGR